MCRSCTRSRGYNCASLSVLSDQLVQRASMDRITIIYSPWARMSWWSLCQVPPVGGRTVVAQLIAIVLDRPLAEAKALVEAPMPSSEPSPESCKTSGTTQSLRKWSPRSRRGPYTLRESSQLLRGHSHRGAVTRHTALPSTQFQWMLAGNVGPHGCHAPNTNNNVIALHTIGVTGQHEVLMVGRYTGDSAKVGRESKSRYCNTT